METETDFPAKVRLAGNSYVMTIPKEAIEQLDLTMGSGIMVHIRKWSK